MRSFPPGMAYCRKCGIGPSGSFCSTCGGELVAENNQIPPVAPEDANSTTAAAGLETTPNRTRAVLAYKKWFGACILWYITAIAVEGLVAGVKHLAGPGYIIEVILGSSFFAAIISTVVAGVVLPVLIGLRFLILRNTQFASFWGWSLTWKTFANRAIVIGVIFGFLMGSAPNA